MPQGRISMKIIFNKIFLEHETGDHPENKKRLGTFKDTEETPLTSIDISNIEEIIRLGHTKEHIERIKKASEQERNLDPDTITCKKSFIVASHAVAATIFAAKNAMEGQNSFAAIRPPGHHATRNKAMGFCLFNNVAITAKQLAKQGKKVMILDFDCHYGNGTADICYNDPQILYVSTHQYPCYPGSGWVNEIGEGEGKGYNMCFPLPPGTGDDVFIPIITEKIKALMEQFKPDIIGVSAGFDAHYSDPITQMNLSANSFYEAGKILKGRKIFAALEGGYNTSNLRANAQAFIDGTTGNKCSTDETATITNGRITAEANRRMELLKQELKKWWKI